MTPCIADGGRIQSAALLAGARIRSKKAATPPVLLISQQTLPGAYPRQIPLLRNQPALRLTELVSAVTPPQIQTFPFACFIQ